ncbi:MAG TPA: HAMP domain-containing sensor histidine kinase [Chloroflexota bacterium]|nr:HAMP domain-containing sensor histidine kinase [Chloroflexota bacterium]
MKAELLRPAAQSAERMLFGSGEVGALMRAIDWVATPLGPVASWPQSLRSTVTILLAAPVPMLVWWGPELAMLYNDACRPLLGRGEHRHAFGQRGCDGWPEMWEVIGPALKRVLMRGEAIRSDDQLLLLERNGRLEERYFTLASSPIPDERGEVAGVLTAVTETTERVLSERRLHTRREPARGEAVHTVDEAAHTDEVALRDANRRLEEFLHLVGHELRSPLTSLKGMTQLGQRRLARLMGEGQVAALPDVRTRLAVIGQTLDAVEMQIGRMNRLITDLLDAARVDGGHLDLRISGHDLSRLVQEVVEALRTAHPHRVITLSRTDHPVVVQADADRIRQVLSQYITNALKYSARDRPVAVSVEQSAHVARVSVRDQGPGLTPDQQARIWERNARITGIKVQDEAIGAGGGSGLGLYISRQIVELHGGRVDVESAPGQGSLFVFTLPSTGDVPVDRDAGDPPALQAQ